MGPVMRQQGWEARLLAVYAAWQVQEFAWDGRDCLGFCRAAELAICGVTRFGDLPPYTSEKDAARKLRRLGFPSVEALISDRAEGCAVGAARRGDWVMRDAPALAPGAFGVVMGRNAAFMGLAGLVLLPVAQSVRAWRIG